MKKLLAAALAAMMMFAVVGCGAKKEAPVEETPATDEAQVELDAATEDTATDAPAEEEAPATDAATDAPAAEEKPAA